MAVKRASILGNWHAAIQWAITSARGETMKRVALFACIGFFALTQIASATSITYGTVGTVNTNNRTIIDATGDTITYNNTGNTTFSSAMATAFANDTGGVWNFDGANFDVAPGQTITLNYGISQSKTEVLTLGGTNNINQANNIGNEPTSGASGLGLGGDGTTRTFTLSEGLLTLGIFNTDRNDASRIPVLTVTFKDGNTAALSTSGANADNTYFHGFTTTLANPIVSFSLSQSNNSFIRYDDLGFVVAPEPTGLSFLGLGAFAICRRKRRQGM
jgi:hypothetical protein